MRAGSPRTTWTGRSARPVTRFGEASSMRRHCSWTPRHPARPPFDRILVDAPCSGLGAARRRPELLWRPGEDNLSSLARLQVAIVSSLVDLLAPGGRLVYSVCTFPRAETDAACDAILRT